MATELSYYRGVEFIKDYFIKYLKALFLAEDKDQIKFFDGTKRKSFSRFPNIVKKGSWDQRAVPCIIIGAASGRHKMVSIAQDFVDASQEGDQANYRDVGGDIELTIDLEIYGPTLEERDTLVDIVSIYLSHPDAKIFFHNHYIRLPEEPTIREGGPVHKTEIDHPIYNSFISMPAVGTWRSTETQGDTLLDIIVDIVAELEL